jgi:NSS family neurotransmitter:Na+ symporter
MDKTKLHRRQIIGPLCGFGFLIGLFFTTHGGFFWFDTIDHFCNSYVGVLLIGLVECLVLGWAFPISKLREHANERSDWKIGIWWDWMIRLVIPAIILFLIGWSIWGDFREPGGYSLFSEKGEILWHNWIGLLIILLLPLLGWLAARFLIPRSENKEQLNG